MVERRRVLFERTNLKEVRIENMGGDEITGGGLAAALLLSSKRHV
jgi:hypothetical protein